MVHIDCLKSNPEIGVRSRFWSVPESLEIWVRPRIHAQRLACQRFGSRRPCMHATTTMTSVRIHTSSKRLRCQRPQPAERGRASRTPGVQASKNFVGRDPDRTFALEIIEPSIEFFPLWVRQRDCARRGRKAVPEFLEELQLLRLAKGGDIDHGIVSESNT